MHCKLKIQHLQVNLCQKLLFLHQLTHNMTTDCSWNYHENYKRRTWADMSIRLCRFTLTTHIKSLHEGQSRFICEYCNRAFGRKPELKSHFNSQHKQKQLV